MINSRKLLVLAAVLALITAPAVADEHIDETEKTEEPEDNSDVEDEETENETEEENETEDVENETETREEGSGIDGTDNSTELFVGESEAEETARESLPDKNWVREESSAHEEDGYYKFEFTLEGEEAEAEVRVDGSSGEVFRQEEELEFGDESDSGSNERATEARIEAKQRQIENLRDKIEELEEEIEQLRNGTLDPEEESDELPGEASDKAEEARDQERELEAERNGRKVEAEIEREDGDTEAKVEVERGPSEEARENVNGTPGNEQAQEKRPGFVSKMLRRFFN